MKEPYNYERDGSHFHCWTTENPPCGLKGEHRCCLCGEPVPQVDNHTTIENREVDNELWQEFKAFIKYFKNREYTEETAKEIEKRVALLIREEKSKSYAEGQSDGVEYGRNSEEESDETPLEKMYRRVKPLVERMQARYPSEINIGGLDPALTQDIAEIALEVLHSDRKERAGVVFERIVEKRLITEASSPDNTYRSGFNAGLSEVALIIKDVMK